MGRVMSSTEKATPAVSRQIFSWKKSSRSNPNGDCIELSRLADASIAVRSSRYPDGLTLTLSSAEMTAFIQRVKNGNFDEVVG
jgi:hypothetical protein